MARSKRINFDVTPEQDAELAWLREALGAQSTKETILRAVRVLAVLSKETKDGAQLVVQGPDGSAMRLLVPELESVGSGWEYLVVRPHSWRRQPWIKGTRIRAATVWSDTVANGLSIEEAAENFDLPEQAVREALAWCSQNQALLKLEAQEERRRLAEGGVDLEPARR